MNPNYLIGPINVGIIAFLAYLVYRKRSWPLSRLFIPGLVVKLVGGVAVGLLYANYYQEQGDTFLFYHDATLLADFFYSDPQGFLRHLIFQQGGPESLVYFDEPRAMIFAQVLAVLKILTFGNYWILSLYLSLFGFLGLWLLANQITQTFAVPGWTTGLAFLFIPSMVFWSSGVLKETLALGIVGVLVADYIKFQTTSRWVIPRLVMDGFLFLLLFGIKYYTAALFLALLATLELTRILAKGSVVIAESPTKQIKYWILIFVVLMFMASTLHPNLYPQHFLDVLVKNHDVMLAISSPTSQIVYYQLQANLGSLLLNFPWAVFSCLYRPVFWEASNVLQGLAALENGIVLVLTLAALSKAGKFFKSDKILWILSCLVYLVLGSGLIALSTPNLGTLARYKVMFIPFLVLLILIDNPLIYRIRNKLRR